MTASPAKQEDILPGQILQAALHLYQKHGLKKVTMDDVSKAIGKSRSVLYYYYKNRDEIFEAVMETLIREVMEEITEAVEKAGSIKDKVRAFCLAKIKTSEERKTVFRAMEAGMNREEISRHTQIMGDMHKRLLKQETSLLKKVLSGSAKKGETRALKPKEQDRLVFLLLGSVRGIRNEMRHENDFSQAGPNMDMLADIITTWLED